MDSYKAIQRVCFFSAFALIGHNCGFPAVRRLEAIGGKAWLNKFYHEKNI